jgi:S-adenosylmethionine uptake transporter
MQSLWMLFATFVFAIMSVCVKLAASYYSTAEIVMYRSSIGVVFLCGLILFQGGTFKTTLPWHHLWRGSIGVTAFWLWFYTMTKLPLATAITLNYMSPIWIAAIVFTIGLRRGENRFEWGLALAILMSFVGVILLLRPSMQADQWAAGLIALFSGFLSALAYLEVRHLGQLGEPEYRVVFYFSLTGLVAGLLGTLFDAYMTPGPTFLWHTHSWTGIALLLAIGVSATMAQIAMTRAYRFGKMLVTANLQYTGIVFSSIWGIIIWDEILGWSGWIGIGLILVSGMTATYYNTRTAKPSAALANDPIATEL